MHIELNLEEDILSLYTPYAAPGNRIQHTRSVLLQKRSGEGDATCFNLISSVTFNLVVSLSSTLTIDAFLRFLILSYTKHAYDKYGTASDVKRHAYVYNMGKNGPSWHAKNFLSRIDMQNRENYDFCNREKIFHDTKEASWQWWKAGSEQIMDQTYRHMRNINFIRDVSEIDIHNDDECFIGERQYRITFDNHVILLHLLEKLRYGQITLFETQVKVKHRVRLLDPVSTGRSHYELFKGHNYLDYVEKQLNASQNAAFSTILQFSKHYECKGGLLQPSLVIDLQDKEREHSITALLTQSTSSTALEKTFDQTSMDFINGEWVEVKPQERKVAKKVEFKVRHNPFFIDLSQNNHIHVEYFERLKGVARRDSSVSNKKTKTVTTKEVKRVSKNQPLLQAFVSQIPEKSKRKVLEEEEEPVVARPLKMPRVEKQQPTLNDFFK